MKVNNIPRLKETSTKEEYIQFMRGPMTDLVKKANKNNPELLKRSLAAIELLCMELSLR